MGTVYEALSERTGVRVALKVLKPEHAEKKDSVARMRHEATVVSRITHPNICNVLEFGEVVSGGQPYLVMERLSGETLANRLEREGRIAVELGVEVALQALAALDAAHAIGVIHRDMKPDNIFLGAEGGVLAKVLDFGISKATIGDDQPHHLTRTGMVMGTPYYMAPEQAMGERQLDGRVDVWGLGVLLYEALTGTRPFIAKNYNALLVQILTGNPEPAAVVNPRIPVGLSNAIHRALAKKRDERFATAREFAKALVPFRQAQRVVSRASERGSGESVGSRRAPIAAPRATERMVQTDDGDRQTRARQAVPHDVKPVQVVVGVEAVAHPPTPSPASRRTVQPRAVESEVPRPDLREGRPGRGTERLKSTEGAEGGKVVERAVGRPAEAVVDPARGSLVAPSTVPRVPSRLAGGVTARRRTEPPPPPLPQSMMAFETADSTFSASASDEEPTQLIDAGSVGDDTPTVEENDLTVVDAPFLIEEWERRSR
jgi:serine/threonine-protein kinase